MRECDNQRSPMDKQDWLFALLFLALALFFYSFLFNASFDGLRCGDEMDYAQIARHIIEGEGFTTSYVSPLQLALNPKVTSQPDLWRPPIYPLLVALSFSVFGVNDASVTLVSGLFFVLLVPLTYLLGRCMFDRTVGIWAALISVTAPPFLDFAMRGQTETITTFLVMLTLYLLYKRTHPLLVGLMAALCYLTHYTLFVVTVIALCFIYREYPRWKRDVPLFVAMLLITILPWWVRNTLTVGNPFFSLQSYEIAMFTDIYPSYSLYHTFTPSNPFEFALSYPFFIIKKAVIGGGGLIWSMPSLLANAFIPALGLAALFDLKKSDKRNIHFLFVILIGLAVEITAVSIIHPLMRVFIIYMPIVIILAAQKITVATQEIKNAAGRIVFLFLVIILVLGANIAWVVRHDYSRPSYFQAAEIAYIDMIVPVNEPVVTDSTVTLAWYGERIEIWFPATYAEMRAHLPYVNYVYFSSGQKEQVFRAQNIELEYIQNPTFHADFELVRQFDSGALFFKKRLVMP